MTSPIADFNRKRDEDSVEELSPFWGIEKGIVLQEARCFNDPQLDARKCQQVITKLLYLHVQGEFFTKTEITEIFFSVTKLFQSKNNNLRRMLYLIIKEICPTSDEVIIVTSSLMKDMNSKVDLYRANAIRVLCCIADSAILGQIERYLKQAIVDRSDAVSSAALISATHLSLADVDIVRRWSSEIQEAVNSSSPEVQFHALGLLYEIRKFDRLSINKLVAQLTRTQLRSPLAQCLLIRYVSEVIKDSAEDTVAPLHTFLQSCMRHKSEIVVFESIRAITSQHDLEAHQLVSVVNVLQLLLSSPKPSSRFAAMRVINKLAFLFPDLISNCNADIENLISDENKSIATLAITTLLKTGGDAAVERLLARIHSFMSEIQDEFKIMIIEAVRITCIRCAHKYRILLSFLSTYLREEGGFEYKQSIVRSIVQLFNAIPEAKELSLSYLSEFIEDCEYTQLSCEVLYLLGKETPYTTDPGKYLRYIYNRVILENPSIRAASISAMASIAVHCEMLKGRVLVLLRRCLFDSDDEVRDRACASIALLEKASAQKAGSLTTHTTEAFENVLLKYCQSNSDEPIDLQTIVTSSSANSESTNSASVLEQEHVISDISYSNIASVPYFATCGDVFKSSMKIDLTEDETEYKISCVKHIFDSHIVFEFICSNTIKEQALTNVTVAMEALGTSGLLEPTVLPLNVMPLTSYGSTFVVFDHEVGTQVEERFACTLKFVSKEIDPITGALEDDGYEDEYSIEDVELLATDFMRSARVQEFSQVWSESESYVENTFSNIVLPHDTVEKSVSHFSSLLGFSPCIGKTVTRNATLHTACFAAELSTGEHVLIKIALSMESQSSVTATVTCRAPQAQLCNQVLSVITC
ncbi:Coatomer gamma subunit [Ostreococcus lucimarinus CCE9901]|jgi:coatomer protein complex subunit gamma|uniref:Coatomer subunit gamma n=1 Tax=Ostreococcus lucimarinus (strain CCE9901) TaxID=436017 RepID=A4RSY5_OSTLU|nr:Coatomer gamma subunit [Ostreococcus lucimarinus CCE9901]ABO94458.1 Coatomer gamma subunit [Ostreococcus lucimarinus CCE9901]|tara:strand:- start:4088 stop:6694 length:2607 start_codon:yes stop_codon:yes gene_type:complete|eukprot:XP_001416165.1 Coatomer gamma subunit [Ostreococcus lucimarinus CCE9901]